MIDTHCHLYLKEFRSDIGQVISNALNEGVQQFYLPAIDSNTSAAMMQLEEDYPGICFSMMGLHPCSVSENYEEELQKVESWLQKRKFAAVGEIGLDFYWSRTFEKQQYESFSRQVQQALRFGIPVVIHSRNATDECIDVIRSFRDELTGTSMALKGVFHCFGGTYAQAMEITGLGFYLGIGGVITYKNAGLAEVVAKVPLQHLVLETDAPYLSPVPFRGKRNESSYLKYVAEKLAQVKGVSREEVIAVTTANAEKLFGG